MGKRSDPDGWSLGWLEAVTMAACAGALVGLSWLLELAPPWWYLPAPRRNLERLDTWAIYAEQGGYAELYWQSWLGWGLIGLIVGLFFSNLVLRARGAHKIFE